jgi:hypothetical protein
MLQQIDFEKMSFEEGLQVLAQQPLDASFEKLTEKEAKTNLLPLWLALGGAGVGGLAGAASTKSLPKRRRRPWSRALTGAILGGLGGGGLGLLASGALGKKTPSDVPRIPYMTQFREDLADLVSGRWGKLTTDIGTDLLEEGATRNYVTRVPGFGIAAVEGIRAQQPKNVGFAPLSKLEAKHIPSGIYGKPGIQAIQSKINQRVGQGRAGWLTRHLPAFVPGSTSPAAIRGRIMSGNIPVTVRAKSISGAPVARRTIAAGDIRDLVRREATPRRRATRGGAHALGWVGGTELLRRWAQATDPVARANARKAKMLYDVQQKQQAGNP